MKKTAKVLIADITSASNNNDMMGLITIHDKMLKNEISVVIKTMKYLKSKDTIAYMVFSQASMMSKVEKNGVFNRIIRQSIRRESIEEMA
jgi:intracellular septation protein A